MKKFGALLAVTTLSLAIATHAPAQQGDLQKKGDAEEKREAKGGLLRLDPAQPQKLMEQVRKGGIGGFGKGGPAQMAFSPADGFDASWRKSAFEAVFEEHYSAEARKRASPALNAIMRIFSPELLNVSMEF